jgi:hypothetical protein
MLVVLTNIERKSVKFLRTGEDSRQSLSSLLLRYLFDLLVDNLN